MMDELTWDVQVGTLNEERDVASGVDFWVVSDEWGGDGVGCVALSGVWSSRSVKITFIVDPEVFALDRRQK
jgi:hypothetical protein